MSAQQVWYVVPGGAGIQNGTSWNDAFAQIQTAINAANSNDEIWVAKGLYQEKLVIQKSGLALYGGFVGNENQVD